MSLLNVIHWIFIGLGAAVGSFEGIVYTVGRCILNPHQKVMDDKLKCASPPHICDSARSAPATWTENTAGKHSHFECAES